MMAPPDDGTADDGTTDDGTTDDGTADDGTTDDGTTDDGTTDDGTTDDGTTDDGTTDDGTTDDGTTDDGTTDDGTTDDGTTDDGTTDDGTITPPPDVGTPPPSESDEVDPADPFEPIEPTALLGSSRLGGLSLNKISGRKFLADLAVRGTGLPAETLATLPSETQDLLVDAIVQIIPKEVPITKRQIREILKSNNLPIFAGKLDGQPLDQGLDYENFGNAITPMPIQLLYDDRMGDRTDPNRKYLTRDNLNLYVRVPSVNVGDVTFGSSDGTLQPKEVQRVGEPGVFGSGTIPYTFRLEEALAATNLPAWPALDNNLEQLFANVTLRYSKELNPADGEYPRFPMTPRFTDNGVVWESEGVEVTQGNNYYYFDVELATPVMLEVLDREALAKLTKAALEGNPPSISDVVDATLNPPLEIKAWSMPDPRNLQLADRGILDALFDDRFRAALTTAMGPLVVKILSGESPTQQEIFSALQKHRMKLENILLGNANKVTTEFESAFDPRLSSVFTIHIIDPESESLWVASFDDIPDGNYFVGATVYDTDGNPLDQMWSDVTVDTSAPEATVAISRGNTNTTGYLNDEDIYIATAPKAGVSAMLNITGVPQRGVVAPGEGYLLYQIVGLNEDGTPYIGESTYERPNTWMPLTIESTMLASRVWDDVLRQLERQGIEIPAALNVPFATILSVLRTPTGPGLLKTQIDPVLKSIEQFIGFNAISLEHAALLIEYLDATIDILNAVPITFGEPDNNLVMPIQSGDMPLLVGEYGIRAMGIDTLFNVSSHTGPTRLRIVNPNDLAEQNRATIMVAQAHGDFDDDGTLDPVYKTGIIYTNTKSVTITGTVTDEHPVQSIVIQYKDASGNWVDIGDATVTGANFEYTWNVDNFDALIGAGDTGTVMVRAQATNVLELTDAEPMEFDITLDAGTYPPGVTDLVVDKTSIMQTNPDSGAPQGTVTINAMTLPLTGPRTVKVRFVATQGDGEPIELGTVTRDDGLVDAVQSAVDAAVEGADAPINTDDTVWSLDVDTVALELADTITKDSPAARDHTQDNNKYTIHAFAVSEDGTEWPSDAITMLSVDNVDDVGPLGPTNITAIAYADGMVEADSQGVYTLRGLIDPHDSSVVSPVATLTIEPEAAIGTYDPDAVMLVSDPEIDAAVISEITETAEGSGVFTVTIDVAALGIEGNGTYKLHALVDDEFKNGQDGESPVSTVLLKNYLRPDPAVFKLMVDVGTEKNADSGGPQGTFTFTGYTIEQNSPPIESILLKSKRASDTDWTTIGTGDASTSVDIEDAALPGVLDHLTDIVVDGTEAGDKSVVAIDATNKQWVVSVDTTELEDTITKDSPAARDASKDDNQYTVRAFAVDASGKEWPSDAEVMFSLDNVDDVAPLAPTGISVTSVDGVNTVFETAEDGSVTVGGLVDKYDTDNVASPEATFTIEPVAERATYKSVRLAMYPEGALVGEITETEEGVSGVFMVTVDVGTLADGMTYLENGTYTFQALAKDEFGNEETDGAKISVTVENSYRPAPEVLVIAVDPESITQTNPDSGAPQGTITLNARSHEITSPPTSGMLFEVKRPGDEEWIDVGTAATDTDSMMVSDVSDAQLTDVVDDIANTAVSDIEAGEADKVPLNLDQTYREWALEVDTTTLEDTITKDSPDPRDASKDDNQYMVRVTAIAEADGSKKVSDEGVTAYFSVDNVDDVPPVGPTNIVAVADVAGMIAANEDGSYTVGGIVDDTVPSPIATFTIEQTADPITYEGGSVNLVQTIADVADGTETTTEGEAGVLDTITIDVGMLENGTYMFHALTVDKFGNVQTDESPQITVHVLNFRVSDVTDIAVVAVDGEDVAEPPAEPIPLRDSVTVSFMVANDSLAADELSGAVNGQDMTGEPLPKEDPENVFTLTVEVGSLVDGVYTPDAMVTKRNGSVAFPVTTVNVDNTGPMVTIESPTEDETVNSLPTIRATYHDGAGSGVNGETGSLALARLRPNEVGEDVDQAELEKDAGSLVYTRRVPLAGGAYRVTVQVTDNLGNVGEGSGEFAVNGTAPTVAINSLASGQTFEHGKPLISGELSGAGTVEVTTFTINDVEAIPEVDGNRFSYTPDEALTNGDYKVVIAVTDGDGNTAQTSVVFVVDIPEPPKDTTPPVISSVAPTGIIKGTDSGSVVISAVVSDEQSAISSVKYSINGGQIKSIANINIAAGRIQAPVDFETHGAGLYTVRLSATSQGGTTEHAWTFTLVVDNVAPTISSVTPNGTIRTELPTVSVSATDESGVKRIRISLFNSQNQQVKGGTENDGVEGKAGGITRADFIPDNPLSEGTYLIIADADDTLGNTATTRGSFTIDFDTAAPIITMASPQQNARFVLKQGDEAPTVSISYADAESGIDVDSITLVIEGAAQQYKATASGTKITLSSEQKSASQVVYPLTVNTKTDPTTWVGKYVVRLEVSDKAHLDGNVSGKDKKSARVANTTVHTFSFFLEAAETPLLAEHVLNYPNPFKDSTTIRFTLTRQSKVNIVIYDTTLRPVRVLVDGIAEPGKKEIEWDGTSSAGVDLARGVYFCQIMVADDIEPEYAILKLALTR